MITSLGWQNIYLKQNCSSLIPDVELILLLRNFFLTYYPYFFPVQVHQSSKLLRVREHIIFWCFWTRSGARTIAEDAEYQKCTLLSQIESIDGRAKCFFKKNPFLTTYFILQIRTLRSQYSQFGIEMYTSGTLHPQQLFVPRSVFKNNGLQNEWSPMGRGQKYLKIWPRGLWMTP